MRILFSILLIFFFSTGLAAQLQTRHWHIGTSTSIVFENGVPTFGGPSAMDGLETSASYADEEGNLLFYTNGGDAPFNPASTGRIWNRNHEVMYDMGTTEGGGSSAAQGAVAFPVPDRENSYYLFTADDLESQATGTNRGISYFIIDMTLNGGLGGVTTSVQMVTENNYETISAIPMADCRGYWVISQDFDTREIIKIPVTADGVGTVTSQNVGLIQAVFWTKFSPNCQFVSLDGKLFSFNNSTGLLSSTPVVELPQSEVRTGAFSADSRYFYATKYNDSSSPNSMIQRYDLAADDIFGSEQDIYTFVPAGTGLPFIGALQLGPNEKLYFITFDGVEGSNEIITKLNEIENPVGPTPQVNEFINESTGSIIQGAQYTLPNFVESVFDVSDPVNPPDIVGADSICLGESNRYEIPIEDNDFAEYTWTLFAANVGTIVGVGPAVTPNFPGPGNYELCAERVDECKEYGVTCRDIVAGGAVRDTIDLPFCGEPVTISDSLVTAAGEYLFSEPDENGCVLTTLYRLRADVVPMQTISLFTCAGETLTVNDVPYSITGTYEQAISRPGSCDSILEILFTVVECNLQASREITDVVCAEDVTGAVTFRVLNGTPPFTYQLTDLSAAVLSSGSIAAINQSVTEGGLSAGTYQITIRDAFGNDLRILNIVVASPDPLLVNVALSDYSDQNISCNGADDGAITLLPAGGTLPYDVRWSDGITSLQRNDLPPAAYSYTVTDNSGCAVSSTILFTEPTVLETEVFTIDATCTDTARGTIITERIRGGTAPYQYLLNGEVFGTDSIFDNLPVGDYVAGVRDANGCTVNTPVTLMGATVPFVFVPEEYRLPIGSEVIVSYTVFNEVRIEIPPSESFSVVERNENSITVLPVRNAYLSITATSATGCVVTDSTLLFISINTGKNVYAPTAFSPNFDGINDVFEVFPGLSVTAIEELRIFDHWGGIQFEQQGDSPVWDGGELNIGSYVWSAKVTYLDGQTEVVSGLVNLFR